MIHKSKRDNFNYNDTKQVIATSNDGKLKNNSKGSATSNEYVSIPPGMSNLTSHYQGQNIQQEAPILEEVEKDSQSSKISQGDKLRKNIK